MSIIDVDDLPSSVTEDVDAATLTIMLAGANAAAGRIAPCLVATDPLPSSEQVDEAKLVLLGAIVRWSRAGSGGVQVVQQGAGPYQQMTTTDTTVRAGYKLWPSEITQLQQICAGDPAPRAFEVDTMPADAGAAPRDRTWITPTDWI